MAPRVRASPSGRGGGGWTRNATSTPCSSSKTVFDTSGVDAPAKEIADLAGAGVGTLYRHFPRRSDLVVAVVEHEVDACADAATALSAAQAPGEALASWLHRYTEFLAIKPGLATALHSGDPAFDELPGYFMQRLEPVLGSLLKRDSERRDTCRHQPERSPLRRRQSVPARGRRRSRVQPTHGRAPDQWTPLQGRYGPSPLLKAMTDRFLSFPTAGATYPPRSLTDQDALAIGPPNGWDSAGSAGSGRIPHRLAARRSARWPRWGIGCEQAA